MHGPWSTDAIFAFICHHHIMQLHQNLLFRFFHPFTGKSLESLLSAVFDELHIFNKFCIFFGENHSIEIFLELFLTLHKNYLIIRYSELLRVKL